MNIARIVFEKGIGIRLNQDASGDRWILESSEDQELVGYPEQVTQRYGVRPVIAFETTKLVGERASLFRTDGHLVWEYYREFFQTYLEHSLSLFQHKMNLDYVLGAVTYHCERLAQVYGRICSSFIEMPRPEPISTSQINWVTIGSPVDPPVVYYELEALITAARRSFDTSRYILWCRFGPGRGSVPRSFAKALPLCSKLPDGLRERLSISWSMFGERLTEYRDCMQHYVHISPVQPFAQMKKLARGVWSTSFWIPDNPEARSGDEFEFRSGIDALTYGWELTHEVLEISKAIVDEVQNPTVA